MKLTPVILLICSLLLPIGSRFVRAEHPAPPSGRLAIAKDEFSLMKNERIGNLRIGLSKAKVKQNGKVSKIFLGAAAE
ncbi:hypothetical protein [Chamaesiphon polymorphus]|nr:hypothetical protein [Chamaesiphon polymorphus]